MITFDGTDHFLYIKRDYFQKPTSDECRYAQENNLDKILIETRDGKHGKRWEHKEGVWTTV